MRSLIRKLQRVVPGPIKLVLKEGQERLRKRLMFGRFAPLIPPERLMHDGPPTYADFKQNAEEFFRLYIDLCDLKPNERMLDVGCGIGRKTVLLTGYLNDQGAYEGIDVVKSGIEWCSHVITKRYQNIKFNHVDLYYRFYNPQGSQRSLEYRFPFSDSSFDLVTLGSVFTHILPKDVEHYLSEITRVLRGGGRCLISWFLLNEESLGLIDSNKSTLDFRYEIEAVCRTIDREQPEMASAYNEDSVRGLYEIKADSRFKDRFTTVLGVVGVSF